MCSMEVVWLWRVYWRIWEQRGKVNCSSLLIARPSLISRSFLRRMSLSMYFKGHLWERDLGVRLGGRLLNLWVCTFSWWSEASVSLLIFPHHTPYEHALYAPLTSYAEQHASLWPTAIEQSIIPVEIALTSLPCLSLLFNSSLFPLLQPFLLVVHGKQLCHIYSIFPGCVTERENFEWRKGGEVGWRDWGKKGERDSKDASHMMAG